MRTARVSITIALFGLVATGCGSDDNSASNAAKKLASKTSLTSEDLSDVSKLAQEFEDQQSEGLPDPCSILTAAVVKKAFGGEPENTDDDSLGCTWDINGTPNFLVEGTTASIPPSVSLRLSRSTLEAWKSTSSMLNGVELDEGIGEARSYGEVAGGLFSWIRKDNVTADLQIVTVGMQADKEKVKSEMLALGAELDDKL